MINLLAGAAIVALLFYALKLFGRIDPKRLARIARSVGGWASILFALLVGSRGHFEVALPLGLFGLSLLGWNVAGMTPWGRTRKSAGQGSSVRTAHLDMRLDHDTGRLAGTVLTGSFAGAELDALDMTSLARLAGEVDVESRQLLEAYLDRRSPGWREDVQGDPGRRRAGAPGGGAMTEEEAYQILGLQPGAGRDDIVKAHRSLMKKLHPDQGGSTYLATRVNQAKDILLSGHR